MNNFECNEAYATEEEYAEQTKRIEAQRPLSDWDKEEIFMTRWFTLFVSTIISLVIWVLFFNLNGYTAILIFSINTFIPPAFFWRKEIKKLIKEKITNWWTLLRGRKP